MEALACHLSVIFLGGGAWHNKVRIGKDEGERSYACVCKCITLTQRMKLCSSKLGVVSR